MKQPILPSCAAALAAIASAVAQAPLFTMTPAVSIASGPGTIQWQLTGPIATTHAVLLGVQGDPFESYGETFLVSYPQIAYLASSSAGTTTRTIAVPASPSFIGAIIYGQPAVLTPQASNGMFLLLNGASSVVHGATSAIALDLADPVAQGFQGNYRSDIAGHIRGGAVLHRTKDTYDPAGALYNFPIQSPLVPQGCREQMVFRTSELGATGEPELVTAVRWLAEGQIYADSFLQFELRMGHSNVVPNYAVDPFTALPIAPGSGLSSVFANNEIAAAPPVTVALGRYDVDPQAAQLSWLGMFVPYLPMVPFRYDGTSSLLLDFRVTQGLLGLNGQKVQLMVQSSPLPAARAVAGGLWWAPMPLPNPGTATQANFVDCAMPILEFDFARVETHAESPWLDSGLANPDYHPAQLAVNNRPGTHIELRYRGSIYANGQGATPWSSSQDVADGMQFLQVDIRLIGNPLTDEVPILDTLVVPIN